MALPVIADVYRVVFNWVGTSSEHPNVSVQHFLTAGSAADLAADLDASFEAGMAHC